MQFNRFSALMVILLMFAACKEISPAGIAEYTNPDYPAQEKGFFFCGDDPSDCCFAPQSSVVWIAVPSLNSLIYKDVSEAVVNPIVSDTLYLGFSPSQLISPESGQFLYASISGSGDIYKIDTELYTYRKVYSCISSVYTMELSPGGDLLYLGSQGAPWHIEAVSTDSWEQVAWLSTDWPVYRLEVSPDNSLVAIGNSGRKEITILEAETLVPGDTLFMPMRTGTMAFTDDSQALVVLDASQVNPCMMKVDIPSGEELYRFSPYNSYLTNCRIQGSNTLILPRNSDERISILNMGNMIFAPSVTLDFRPGETCISRDGEYMVTITRTTSPGRATVFHYGE